MADMTCRCPPRLCYFRPDCRKLARAKPFAPPPQPTPIAAARLMWLEEQHDRLTEEITQERSPARRKSKEDALALISGAIARFGRVVI